MIIGIQDGLYELKGQLEQRGYPVKEMNNYSNHVDVYIYASGKVDGVLLEPEINLLASFNNCNSSHCGTLMVNSKGKSINEIESIINNRCYTSLDLY